MTAKTFINPFHFVPPIKAVDPTEIGAVQQALQDRPSQWHLLHDRYVAGADGSGEPECFSGRIICRLTTKTPCVFGSVHQKVKVPQENGGGHTLEDATRVDNFSIDGYAAIAGTSLKGMLSTIAELASGSAMRVLNNRALSIRSSMKQAKSAMGLIVVHQGRRMLLPLALPTFSERDAGSGVFKPTYCWEDAENLIWDEIIRRRREIEPEATLTAIYVRKETPGEFCFHHGRPVVALPGRYPGIAWDHKHTRPQAAQDPRVRKQAFLRPVKNGPPSERGRPFEVVPVDPSQDQTWGIVRRLQRPSVSPAKLWFSMFLPVSPAWRNAAGQFELPDAHKHKPGLLLDAEDACQAFDDMVTDPFSNAPEEPSCTALEGQTKFTRRPTSGEDRQNSGLRDGDLVFFRPSSATSVESVAIAGIWREGVRWMWNPDADHRSLSVPTLLDSPELRPMNRTRTLVTMAEKLFGWVEDVSPSKRPANGDAPFVTAYKGRVRVSDAISPDRLEQVLMAPNPATRDADSNVRGYYPLKILGSPKPPCPELYMRDKSRRDNTALRQNFPSASAGDITIQGWKMYLLEQRAIDCDDAGRWQTRHPELRVEQKSWVRPVKCGTEFWFHVDFENLTSPELQLLCYALRPADEFVHRCGYGKPLQLGGVKIEPQAITTIDRRQRYRSAVKLLAAGRRYDRVTVEGHNALQSLDTEAYPQVLRERGYHRLAPPGAPSGKSGAADERAGLRVRALAEEFAGGIGEHHRIVKLAGTPLGVPPGCCGISYPRLQSQDDEDEIYRWFVANRDEDAGLLQPPLRPLSDQAGEVPALKMGIAVALDLRIANERDITRRLKDLARQWQLPLEIRRVRDDHQNCLADRSLDVLIGFEGFEVDRPRIKPGPNRKVDLQELKTWLMRLID